jgi:hypothetical protein
MSSLLLDFTGAAAKTVSAPQDRFDFTAAAREVYDTFPDLKEKLFFYDLGQSRWVTPGVQTHQALKKLEDEYPHAFDLLQGYMKHYAAEKNSCAWRGPGKTRFVLLYTNPDRMRLLGPNVPLKQDIQFVLDHELGHLLAKNGGRSLESLTRHENVADTYAALRHFQRFGMDSPAIAHQVLWRAQRVVSLTGGRHEEHFTGFVLEKLLAEKDSLNIQNLTPRETVALAGDFATRHTPEDARVRSLSAVFNRFKARLHQDATAPGADWLPPRENAFRTLADTLLAATNADALHWGRKVLEAYIDGAIGKQLNGKVMVNDPPAVLAGDYWQGIRKQLDARIRSMPGPDAQGALILPAAAPDKACPTRRLLMRKLQG